jgi:hypothetical protein
LESMRTHDLLQQPQGKPKLFSQRLQSIRADSRIVT